MAWLDQTLGPLEIAINRGLATSPDALAALARESGALSITLRDLGWSFSLCLVPHGFALMPGQAAGSRAQVSTSLIGLARLFAGEDLPSLGSALVLEGDVEFAQRLLEILSRARVDLEAEIGSRLRAFTPPGLGDSLAGLLGPARESLRGLLRGPAAKSIAKSADLPPPEDLRDWMRQVDELALQVDRLEARAARLAQRRSGE